MFMGWNGEFHFLWRRLGLGSCPSVPSIPRIQCLGIMAASLQGSYRDETESTEAPRKSGAQVSTEAPPGPTHVAVLASQTVGRQETKWLVSSHMGQTPQVQG